MRDGGAKRKYRCSETATAVRSPGDGAVVERVAVADAPCGTANCVRSNSLSGWLVSSTTSIVMSPLFSAVNPFSTVPPGAVPAGRSSPSTDT